MPQQVHSGLSATGKQRVSRQLLSPSSHRRLARRRPQGRASRPELYVIEGRRYQAAAHATRAPAYQGMVILQLLPGGSLLTTQEVFHDFCEAAPTLQMIRCLFLTTKRCAIKA